MIAFEEEIKTLNTQNKELTENNARLTQEIDSLNDPKWVEMILMKELGVVPEGQIKVYFSPK